VYGQQGFMWSTCLRASRDCRRRGVEQAGAHRCSHMAGNEAISLEESHEERAVRPAAAGNKRAGGRSTRPCDVLKETNDLMRFGIIKDMGQRFLTAAQAPAEYGPDKDGTGQ
jgi:hypothetical protein